MLIYHKRKLLILGLSIEGSGGGGGGGGGGRKLQSASELEFCNFGKTIYFALSETFKVLPAALCHSRPEDEATGIL